jgi:hypothetical protein
LLPANGMVKKGVVKGFSKSALNHNTKLKQLKDKAIDLHSKYVAQAVPVSAELIKSNLQGAKMQNITLLYAISYHNGLFKSKLGSGSSKATYTKYQTLKSKVICFLKWKYRRSDIGLKELNHQFLVAFDMYLITSDKIAHNTAMKYIQQLKKIIHLSVAHSWLILNSICSLSMYVFTC